VITDGWHETRPRAHFYYLNGHVYARVYADWSGANPIIGAALNVDDIQYRPYPSVDEAKAIIQAIVHLQGNIE